MNRKKRLLVVMLSCILSCEIADAKRPLSIPPGRVISSPDATFDVQLVEAPFPRAHSPKTSCLAIISKQDKTRSLVGVITPVHCIKWTKDSRCIITVEHVSGGTTSAVIHYRNGGWNRQEVDPVGTMFPGHCAVIELIIRDNVTKIVYEVSDESAGQLQPEFYICEYTVNSSTGEVTKTSRKDYINVATYIAKGEHFTCESK